MTEEKTTAESTTTQTPEAKAPANGHVLLDRTCDIAAFCSTDPGRYSIQGVHYNAELHCVEATDGKMLIRVPVSPIPADDFPSLTNPVGPAVDSIIPTEPFKKAIARLPKSAKLPVLETVYLGAPAKKENENQKATMVTNDLDSEQMTTTTCIDAKFPNFEQVIPTSPEKFAVALSPTLLAKICAYAEKHGTARSIGIRFGFRSELEPITFSINLSNDNRATGLLMPIRMT